MITAGTTLEGLYTYVDTLGWLEYDSMKGHTSLLGALHQACLSDIVSHVEALLLKRELIRGSVCLLIDRLKACEVKIVVS